MSVNFSSILGQAFDATLFEPQYDMDTLKPVTPELVHEAKMAWREAVRERNRVLSELDNNVKRLRTHYRNLRDN